MKYVIFKKLFAFNAIRWALAVLVTIVFFSLGFAASAELPTTIGYQGRLKNSSGTVQSGTFSFTFRLYASSTGGTAIWSETQSSVSVSDGFFAVRLGNTTPFPTDFNSPLFITTEVNGDGEMSPRVAINAVPYALTTGGVNALPSAPVASPYATGGRMYYNTGSGRLFYYDGIQDVWVEVATPSSTVSEADTFQSVISRGNQTSSTIQFAGGTSTGDFLPGTDATYFLGTASFRWLGLSAVSVTSTNLSATEASFANVTSTNIFGTNAAFTNTTTTNLYASLFSSASGTITNFNTNDFFFISGTGTNLYVVNLLGTNALFESTTSTNLFSANAVFTSATTTNFFATYGNVTNITGTNATFTNLSVGSFNPTNITWVNATGTNTTSTNLFAQNLLLFEEPQDL